MNDKSQVESILNDIKSMINNVIVKLSYQAELYETVDIKRDADRYVSAYLERDTFNSYRYYPMDVLAKAGISDLNELTAYTEDRHKIPRDKRKAVLKAMREAVINEYEERNDYYRELIGKPSINSSESEWIYLTEDEMLYYEIDEVRPIHDYPVEIQYKLEKDLIPRLIKQYPEKTYLQHFGSKAVNLVRAREAKNFEIIFTDITLDVVFMRAFFDTYDFAREYFMGLIYNKAFKDRYSLYDNYIGMHIMIMTIQRLVVDTIKMGIDRDFYDLISIQKLFNVYGIPFYDDLPLDYQRTIVKNVNMLIRSKSTDKVLYDIANTLFYERVKIYKYYLVRERRFDENGDPVFLYKEELLDEPPEKFYIKSDNGKSYELAIIGYRFATVECDNPFAPEQMYIEDETDGKVYRLYMEDDKLSMELVETDSQVRTSIIMYNEKVEKFLLAVNKGKLEIIQTKLNTTIEYDYENMFDIYFQATDIMERNVISTLETKYNRYHYDEVVRDDVYWWETEELKKELYERDYNFIDTKYISVTVMQNLTKMLYETVYYLNLLVDHKNTTTELSQRILNTDAMKTGTDYLYLKLDRFSTVPVSIFDAVMMLCALVSKKNGMKGNIIVKSPSQILSVLGFNFEANFDLIRENIKKYKRVFKNQEILKYLDLLDIRTVGDIDILFNNFKNFAEFCSNMVATTTDINEYKAYKELYKVITVREDSINLFTMSNGEVAGTYLEYLYDKLPVIAEKIDEMHKDKTGIYIEHILGKLNELIPEIEYLNTINGTNNNIVQAIMGLINFFKSYTVDLRALNIMYMFDNKMFNKIYMIDDPRLFITLFPNETLPVYNDTLTTAVRIDKSGNLVIYDRAAIYNTLRPKDYVGQYAEIEQLLNKFKINDTLELDYKDIIEVYKQIKVNDDVIDLREQSHIYDSISHKEEFNTEHKLVLYNILSIQETFGLDYKDVILFIKQIYANENMCLKYKYMILDKIMQNEKLNLDHILTLCLSWGIIDNLELDYKDLVKNMLMNYHLDGNIDFEYMYNIDDVIYHNKVYDVVEKLMQWDESMKVFDCIELGYKDIIKLMENELQLYKELKLKHKGLMFDNIMYKEKFIKEHLFKVENMIYHRDIIELDYKEILYDMSSIVSSNTGIHFNDTIKVTYED